MKKHVVFALAVFLFNAMPFAEAEAQMMHGQKQGQGMGGAMMGQGMHGGMMDQGMMCGMTGEGMHGGFDFHLNNADELGLTETQVDQLRTIKYDFEKAEIQLKATIQVAQLELQQLKGVDKVDAKKVEAKIREIQDKKADLEVTTFRAQTEAKKVLTAEQEAKLENITCALSGGMMGKGMMMQRQEEEDLDSSSHDQHHRID